MDQSTVELLKAAAASLVRHGLTALGTWLVTKGALASGDQSQFVTISAGVVAAGGSYLWSLWQKKGAAGVIADLKTLRGHLQKAQPVPPTVTGASAINAAIAESKKAA